MQRYEPDIEGRDGTGWWGTMTATPDGDYILYADHQQAVAKAREALTELLAEMINPVHVHHLNKWAEYQISPEAITAAREALAALSPTDSGK
jgi:hypothetical protein